MPLPKELILILLRRVNTTEVIRQVNHSVRIGLPLLLREEMLPRPNCTMITRCQYL